MSELRSDSVAPEAAELLGAARARLPWLKRAGVLPGGCPASRDHWQETFRTAGVALLWPELCEAEGDLVVKAHRLLELGAEILIASPAEAGILSGAGLLAPVFTVGA